MTLEELHNQPKTFIEWIRYVKNGDLAWYLAACKAEKDMWDAIMESDLIKEFGNNYTPQK